MKHHPVHMAAVVVLAVALLSVSASATVWLPDPGVLQKVLTCTSVSTQENYGDGDVRRLFTFTKNGISRPISVTVSIVKHFGESDPFAVGIDYQFTLSDLGASVSYDGTVIVNTTIDCTSVSTEADYGDGQIRRLYTFSEGASISRPISLTLSRTQASEANDAYAVGTTYRIGISRPIG